MRGPPPPPAPRLLPSSAPAATPPRLARVRQSLSLVLQREDAPFPPYRQRKLINQKSGFPRERQRSAKKIARWRVFLASARHELAKLALETRYPFPAPIPWYGVVRIRSDRRFPRRRRIPPPSTSFPRLGGSNKTALDNGTRLAESPRVCSPQRRARRPGAHDRPLADPPAA